MALQPVTIGKLIHRGYIIHNVWASDGYGGQTITSTQKHKCAVGVIGSNGKEMFQNEAIFNIKTLTIIIRVVDSANVTEGDRIEIDGNEYNIRNVELYERNRNYNRLVVSREIITGD